MSNKEFIDSINTKLHTAIKNADCNTIRGVVEEFSNHVSFPFEDYPEETFKYNTLVDEGYKILIKN